MKSEIEIEIEIEMKIVSSEFSRRQKRRHKGKPIEMELGQGDQCALALRTAAVSAQQSPANVSEEKERSRQLIFDSQNSISSIGHRLASLSAA